MTSTSTPKVADFGVARLYQSTLIRTCSGDLGTPAWMAVGDTVILHCRWLSFLRDLPSNPAVIAVTFCPNDSVAAG